MLQAMLQKQACPSSRNRPSPLLPFPLSFCPTPLHFRLLQHDHKSLCYLAVLSMVWWLKALGAPTAPTVQPSNLEQKCLLH